MLGPIPEQLFFNGVPYTLLETRPGVRKWDTEEVASQPGDGGKETVYAVEMHGGFGASRRFFDGQGKVSDPTHHAYTQNWLTHIKGVAAPAPRITYIDCTPGVARRGFRLGGSRYGQLGGGFAALGGGEYIAQVSIITEYGNYLYCTAGSRTFVVDPSTATPSLVETHQHPDAGSRGLSAAVFDGRLVVALGSATDIATAATPRSGAAGTPWTTVPGVRMDAFEVGGGGRLFSSQENYVFNVLPGVDPTDPASYLPPAGELITDETDHIHALAEYARGLVASTHLTLRTFDPDAGFVSRAMLPSLRSTSDEYHGRALIIIGEDMFYATPRAVWWFRVSRGLTSFPPERIGAELLVNNQTPYKGGQPGVPAFDGEIIYWPYYYPTTGDSVIWRVAPRQQGEPGTGPYVWSEFLYLASRECRCVTYWGGDDDYKPRLFFGAGSSSSQQQVGWVQLGRGGSPDLFDGGSVPALAAVAYGAIDDFGKPPVMREVLRMEIPSIAHADASNYLAVAISDDEGVTFKNLVVTNTGAANDERVTGTGFQQVFADVATPSIPAGRTLQVRYTATQASGATQHLQVLGTPQLYVVERPATVEQVTTLLHFEPEVLGVDDVETAVNRMKAHVAGAKVQLQHAPGDVGSYYVKVVEVKSAEVEVVSAEGAHAERRLAMQVTFREVSTGL